MTENKRYSFNWERGHPNFWDNYCDLADCYLTCEDVCELLNKLAEENTRLKHTNQELYDKLQVTMSEKSLKGGEIAILKRENKELKKKVGDKEVAVEVETEKVMNKVLGAIDAKINELSLTTKYGDIKEELKIFGQQLLIELEKELKK